MVGSTCAQRRIRVESTLDGHGEWGHFGRRIEFYVFVGGPVAQNFAYYAGTTMDQTLIGGFFNSLPFVPQPIWNVLSATFAMNAVDPAAVILGEGPGWVLEARILALRGISVVR